jgi:hypothetical protein
MDKYFSSPDLYNDLTEENINCCGTVRTNRKGIPDFRSKALKLKQEGINERTSGAMTVVIKKDKCDVHMLKNIHNPKDDGNFCDESGNILKSAIAEDYNRHMDYINKSDRRQTTNLTVSVHGNG